MQTLADISYFNLSVTMCNLCCYSIRFNYLPSGIPQCSAKICKVSCERASKNVSYGFGKTLKQYFNLVLNTRCSISARHEEVSEPYLQLISNLIDLPVEAMSLQLLGITLELTAACIGSTYYQSCIG